MRLLLYDFVLPSANSRPQDLQHVTFRLYNGNIFTAPVPNNVRCVLDIGCGSGVWLRDFAKQFPSARLYGVDLNPPESLKHTFPSNVEFRRANIEERWDFAKDITPIDFIFDRLLMTSVRQWPVVFNSAFQNLRPGGMIEMQETISHLYAADGTTAKDSPAIRWHEVVRSVLEQNGIDPDAAMNLSPKLQAAGFRILADKEVRWNAYVQEGEDGEREKQIAVNFKQALINLFNMMTPKLFAQADIAAEEKASLARDAVDDIINNSAKRGYYALK